MVVPRYEAIEKLKVSSPKTIISALVDTLEATYPNGSHYCFPNVFFPMEHFPDRFYDGLQRPYMHLNIQVLTYITVHTYITLMDPHSLKYTYIHTYIHTHIHTYIHLIST